MTRTLEENLNVLRVLDGDRLVDLIEQLPEHRRAAAAAFVVRQEAPARDAILGASHADLPAGVDRMTALEGSR